MTIFPVEAGSLSSSGFFFSSASSPTLVHRRGKKGGEKQNSSDYKKSKGNRPMEKNPEASPGKEQGEAKVRFEHRAEYEAED